MKAFDLSQIIDGSMINLNILPGVYQPKAFPLSKILAPVGIIAGVAVLGFMGYLYYDSVNRTEVLNTEIYDKIITVTYDDAVKTARRLAKLEGLFVGISAGACAWAAIYVASKDFEEGENIVALLPDGGEKYLSTDLFRF